ncbi:MAG: preprotein translocase subunit SecG [Pseudomonadota bacterium]
MENVVLVIHLLLALALIAVVLLQRSEGGGLGMGGGGGGGGGIMSSRGAATALGKVTWGLAIAFICTSMALTIFAAQNAGDASVLDRLGTPAADGTDPILPPADDALLPPPAPATDGGTTAPLPRAE